MDRDSSGADRPEAAEPIDAALFVDAVFRLARAVNRIGNTRLRPWDMTLSSYAAMRVLADRPNLSLAQVARRCFVRPQTMTRIVAELHNRGLVQRSPNAESKRAMWLTLTDDGAETLAEMTQEVNRINHPLGLVMNAEEASELEARLRQCAVLVEQAADRVADEQRAGRRSP